MLLSAMIVFSVAGTAHAQLGSILQGIFTSMLPSMDVPLISSPYVLNSQGIRKNLNNNTWDIPYSIPPNTNASNFTMQINGTTLTGLPIAQILNGQLVFKVPDASFAVGGTAMIGLVRRAPFQVVSLNVVAVLAQGFQPSPYILNMRSIVKNDNATWDVGYFIPQNTDASQMSLTVGNKAPLRNGAIAFGGLIFKVPETSFVSGQTVNLVLRDGSGQVRAANVVTVPPAGRSPYVLNPASIRQNTDMSWNVGYEIPANINARDFGVFVGPTTLVMTGQVVGGQLVFTVPETLMTAGSRLVLSLQDVSTGIIRATDTITVPAGLPPQYVLNRSLITQQLEGDKSWRIGYDIPVNTISSEFELIVGNKGTYTNGLIVNSALVFQVPADKFGVSDIESLKLRNKVTGKIYNANGTVTQGKPDEPIPDTSRSNGGLLITFPPAKQNIQQTRAVIRATIRALVDLPSVNVSYIWNRTGDPTANREESLLVVAPPVGLEAGQEREMPLSFIGLSPGATYTFVLKNNVTNVTSDPIQFTTPLNPGDKAYIQYEGDQFDYGSGGYDAPAGGDGIVTDTISDKGIVPLCGRTWYESSGLPEDADQFQPCGLDDFFQLISNLIQYGIIIIGPIVAILAMYSGFQIMILGRIPDKNSEQFQRFKAAQARLVKIAIGLAIMLSGYILITTITRELGVKETYTFLDLLSGN